MILNNSPAIYVDGKMAERVYADGELVWGLPKGYKRCKYLESSKKQYIDTEITAEYLHSLLDIMPVMPTDSYFIGFSDGSYQISSGGWFGDNLREAYPTYFYASRMGLMTRHIIECRYGFELSGLASRYVAMDGVVIKNESIARPNYKALYSFYLFGRNRIGVYDQGYIGRGYSATMFDMNGVKLRSFLPALDDTGRPCMYDTVSKQPFYNSGTGEFGYELMDGTYVAPI